MKSATATARAMTDAELAKLPALIKEISQKQSLAGAMKREQRRRNKPKKEPRWQP